MPINGNKVVGAVMLLPKFLSRKISPEKSLDFLSQKLVLRPALNTVYVYKYFVRIKKKSVYKTVVFQSNFDRDPPLFPFFPNGITA